MTTTISLPAGFADLEQFTVWCKPTEAERNKQRRASEFSDIQALYDAVLPRLDQIFEFLTTYSLDDMPADVRALLELTLALAEVAPAVEWYGQPTVTDGFDPERFVIYQ